MSKKEELKEAYEAGKDCKANGANTTNCNFRHFATPEQTKAWELGKMGLEFKNEN